MTPEQEKIINEWIKRVEGWLEERNASPAFVESARERIKMYIATRWNLSRARESRESGRSRKDQTATGR
jgi:hypothetical protein